MKSQAPKGPANKNHNILGIASQKIPNQNNTQQFMGENGAGSSLSNLQRLADNSRQTRQAAQLQSLADQSTAQQQAARLGGGLAKTTGATSVSVDAGRGATIQQRALIVPRDISDERVKLEAEGKVSDFKGGSSAKNYGWNGVEKYHSRAKVDGNIIDSGYISNDYLNAQAGHVLAEKNGGAGDDPDNVFAQDGGVNNGTYRSRFENPMRRALDAADDTDQVKFLSTLYGTKISNGSLLKESDKMDVSSEESSDWSDSDSESD